MTKIVKAKYRARIVTSFGHSAKRIKESYIEDVPIDTQDSLEKLKPRALQ